MITSHHTKSYPINYPISLYIPFIKSTYPTRGVLLSQRYPPDAPRRNRWDSWSRDPDVHKEDPQSFTVALNEWFERDSWKIWRNITMFIILDIQYVYPSMFNSSSRPYTVSYHQKCLLCDVYRPISKVKIFYPFSFITINLQPHISPNFA